MNSSCKIVAHDERIVNAFDSAGGYKLVRDGAEHMPAALSYIPSQRSNAPVALLLPGYREDVLDPDLTRVADMLEAKGFAVASLNYGGLDNDDENAPDFATQASHIEDTRAALSCFDACDVTIFCTSNGLASAFNGLDNPLQAKKLQVPEIFLLNPFPDFIKERVKPIVEGARPAFRKKRDDFYGQGFFVLSDRSRKKIKFTKAFYDSALQYDAFSRDFADMLHKPKVTAIYMKDDKIVEFPSVKGGDKPRLVPKWIEHMRGLGFDIESHPLEGDDHVLTQPIFDVLDRCLGR